MGHLDCLRYARENGCDWNDYTAITAAINGHLECLRYVHEHGCELNIDFIKNRLRGHLRQVECFKYCFEVCDNPQKFWDTEILAIDQMTEQIDLDDQVWRRLFEVDLKLYTSLQTKVHEKRTQISEMKLAALGVLGELVELDVVKYCICEYF
jgi:hypothetical protein